MKIQVCSIAKENTVGIVSNFPAEWFEFISVLYIVMVTELQSKTNLPVAGVLNIIGWGLI